MDTLRRWLKSLWRCLAAVLAVALLAYFFGRRPPAEITALRWSDATVASTSPAFDALVNKTAPKNQFPNKITDWRIPHVAVYSVPAIPPPAPPAPTLASLADIGQAHAIDFLAFGTKDQPHSWADLQKTLVAVANTPEGKDPFRFDRVLVATVTRGAFWDPGDRMMWSRVFVQPVNFRFAGYTVAATENETVKVTSVEDTVTHKFSTDIGLTIPGVKGPEGKSTFGSENSQKSTADISAQYEKLGIDIMPNFLRIIRESETGGDVLGNTQISLSVLTDPSMIKKTDPKAEKDESADAGMPDDQEEALLVSNTHLYEGASEVPEADASITALPQVPLRHCPLMARIWMLYEIRHIEAGRKFYEEYRQSVSLRREADPPRYVEIVAADDVSPAVWSIQIRPQVNPPPTARKQFLRAGVDGGIPRVLAFTDFTQASIVAHWARTNWAGTVSKLKLDYSPENGSLVPVKSIWNTCPTNG